MDKNTTEIIIWILVVVIFIVLVGGILAGQSLRNERAATVIADEFTMSISAPSGYRCYLDANEAAPNMVTVHCKP